MALTEKEASLFKDAFVLFDRNAQGSLNAADMEAVWSSMGRAFGAGELDGACKAECGSWVGFCCLWQTKLVRVAWDRGDRPLVSRVALAGDWGTSRGLLVHSRHILIPCVVPSS
jgi:hypothetical protein